MITKILKKHQCNGYYPELKNLYDENYHNEGCNKYAELESKIQEKWTDYIPRGWYGFAIGKVPDKWFYVIDEFLEYLDSIVSGFEIHQIKVKFGGIRFYIEYDSGDDETNEFIELQIEKLERMLYSEDLVY